MKFIHKGTEKQGQLVDDDSNDPMARTMPRLPITEAAKTVVLDDRKYIRVLAPGIDVTAKLTPEEVAKLVAFTLDLVSARHVTRDGPG